VSTVGVLVALAVLFLAYSNGANDNFKGVATLLGGGLCSYRRALAWATVTTAVGCLLALVLANGLVATFSGRGLVPDRVTTEPGFLLAVSLGAALTVLVATATGLPVSTTHALVGGLVGAGLVAAPGQVSLAALGTSFLLPLLTSPLAAMLLTFLAYSLMARSTPATLPKGAPVERGRWGRRDWLHFLSGGAVGFARGLNDAPKIVAILLAVSALAADASLGLVMALGGLLSARRIAETMSRKITSMNPDQGLVANLVTAALVLAASRLSLPVSTTHVAVGSLFAIGLIRGTAQVKMIAGILLAWVTTLPLAALLAGLIYQVIWAAGTFS